MTQAPYISAYEPHRRSAYETSVHLELNDSLCSIYFECQADVRRNTESLQAIGDPDLWKSEYVQVQLPVGEDGGCPHLSVSRPGQMLSERFDKQRDPIPGWQADTEDTSTGWRASITIPRIHLPCPFRLRLARWAPDEGITRWPTAFGTWWHVETPDFLEVDPAGLPPNEQLDTEAERWMKERESCLYKATSTPDPQSTRRGEWLSKAEEFLSIPIRQDGDFLRHLQSRLEEQPWLAFGDISPPNIERCQALLANRVYFEDAVIDLGPELDWESDHGNAYVMCHATRFDFLADLVAAFRYTDDAIYAQRAITLIESWMDGHDMRQSLTPGRYPIRWAAAIIASHRLVCMVRTLFSLLPTGLVGEELFLKLFAAARENSAVLSPRLPRLYPKNHSIIIGDHMVQLSVLCQELKDAETICSCYWEHLRRALREQFLPDGVQAELSTMYHLVCYIRLTEATSLCEQASIVVPDDITHWRRRILTVAAKYLFPNGQIAAFNDGSMQGRVDAVGQADMSLREIILRDARALGAEEALAIATGSECGKSPPQLSNALLFAGHFMLRDGFAPDSMALAFDAGPFGLAHAHEDALSVMLVRYGKPFLIDIGSGAYDPGVPMREYSTSTQSHSTICIDGQGQAAGARPEHWKRLTPFEGHHYFGPTIQFAHGEYSYGYDGGKIPVSHQRAVLFANQSYVILIDYLSGEGPHLVESHFAVAPLPYEMTAQGLRTTSGDGDLDISILYPPQAEVSVACGQKEPFAGWMPDGGYGLRPHPRLTFRLPDHQLPSCLLTLLSPFREPEEIGNYQVCESVDTIEVEINRGASKSILTCSRLPLDITLRHDRGCFRASKNTQGKLHFQAE
jgi:hypothetical protein